MIGKTATAYLVVMLLLSGCAAWEKVGGAYNAQSDGFQVEFPADWNRNARVKERHRITRDGELLQVIEVARVAIDKELPNTKRKFAVSMLPVEAAELVFDTIRSSPSIMNAQILENVPGSVSGLPGFKLAYSYNTEAGLKKMGIFYGVLRSSYFYYAHYYAPARHYFQKDLATFEKVKESFKIKA